MRVVLFSLILNNHQANIADELWELTSHQFCFVELADLQAEHRKGDTGHGSLLNPMPRL